MDTPSLRLMAFYYAHPEKIQFIRNASYEYWYAYKKLGLYRVNVSKRWEMVSDYLEDAFPSIYHELIDISGYWDDIDSEEFDGENG